MSASSGQNQNADESSAFFANNDASSYNTRYLKSIRNKERFQELHFYQCSVQLLDELFPKQAQKGTLNPPASYRASAVTLGQWRELDEHEQTAVLQKEKQAQGGDANKENGGGDLKRAPNEGEEISSAPATKVVKTEEQSKVNVDIPGKWNPSSIDLDANFCKDRTCRGITLDLLKSSYPTEEAKLSGFGVLVADAMQFKAQAYNSGQSWPFASDPGVAGALVEESQADNNKSMVALKWVCVVEVSTNRNKLHSVRLHHFSCDRESQASPCQNCRAHLLDVLTLCGERAV